MNECARLIFLVSMTELVKSLVDTEPCYSTIKTLFDSEVFTQTCFHVGRTKGSYSVYMLHWAAVAL